MYIVSIYIKLQHIKLLCCQVLVWQLSKTLVEMCAITNKGSVTKYIYQAKIYIAG